MKFWIVLVAFLLALAGCSGGTSVPLGSGGTGGGGGGTGLSASVAVALSSNTVTSAEPATVTAKVLDSLGHAVVGVVVDFTVNAAFGSLSAPAALSDSSGVATVTLSPANAQAVGADTVTATTTVAGTAVTGSAGYQLSATTAAITSFSPNTGESDTDPLASYGQAELTVTMTGVSPAAPVTLNVTSACVAAGKATITPTTQTNTSGTAVFTYKDSGGCGSIFPGGDNVTVSVAGSSTTDSTTVFLTPPTPNSISFTNANPATIYLKGSGYVESSTVTFTVVDQAGNPLPGQLVTLNLSTFAGGLTLDQKSQTELQANPDVKTSDSNGVVSAIVNSGTVPTPVRVTAQLSSGASTVSSNLAVVTGLPSELHFSLSQKTINIEGWNYDGGPLAPWAENSYTIIASDRSGNPVPDQTAVLFWAEGGQVQGSATTVTTNGTSAAVGTYVAASPRPSDGRVTVLSYAIGEESFVDLHGTNVWQSDDPFQDLGNIVKDQLYDGIYDPANDEVISLSDLGVGSGGSACTSFSGQYPQLALGADIPNQPNTCDATWSPKTYVRRATETILSTSGGQAYADYSQLGGTCFSIPINNTPPTLGPQIQVFPVASSANNTIIVTSASGSVNLLIADLNPYRLNPMAAGTIVTATSTSPANVTATVPFGSGSFVVPSTNYPTYVPITYQFIGLATTGSIQVNAASPSGVVTGIPFNIQIGTPSCPNPNPH